MPHVFGELAVRLLFKKELGTSVARERAKRATRAKLPVECPTQAYFCTFLGGAGGTFLKRVGNERRARASEASYAREALSRMPDANRSFHIPSGIRVANPSDPYFQRASAMAYL